MSNNKLKTAQLDLSATNKLVGRTTAGAGAGEEVTLDTDGTLSANSDTVVATQKAVKTYSDTKATAGAVTSSGLTMSTAKLLGRSTAGTGTIEEITKPSGAILGDTDTQTLTNKRITPRVLSAASYTTDTGTSLNVDNYDQFIVTAQAGALKLNNPSGTPTDGQKLIVAITGTAARALTYDTQFQASTVAIPTTTVTTARITMGFIWASATSKWIIVAVS